MVEVYPQLIRISLGAYQGQAAVWDVSSLLPETSLVVMPLNYGHRAFLAMGNDGSRVWDEPGGNMILQTGSCPRPTEPPGDAKAQYQITSRRYPINIPSNISFFWIFHKDIPYHQLAVPNIGSFHHCGTALRWTFYPPGTLPPTAGDRARWEAAMDFG